MPARGFSPENRVTRHRALQGRWKLMPDLACRDFDEVSQWSLTSAMCGCFTGPGHLSHQPSIRLLRRNFEQKEAKEAKEAGTNDTVLSGGFDELCRELCRKFFEVTGRNRRRSR